VLGLVATGRTDREIADALGIGRSTTRGHVSRAMGKLGVGDRVEAAVVAARLGLALDADVDGREPRPAEPPTSGAPVRRTFLFTDMVRSTALIEVVGDAAWRDLRRWHDATLRRLFEQHAGREVDHAGDGFFVAFDHAADAVRCARAIQRTLAEHRRATGFAPSLRIGLHSGEAQPDGQAYAGRAVHVAARVTARADGGEILASDAVVREAGLATGERLTEVRLKGIPDLVAVATLPW
jgi:class 3 adenylate cyclase